MPLTIPFEIFLKIMGYMENPTMGEYIRLAQVNRDFRAFFLSDAAWAKFDVYGVRDEVHVYRHGGYELRGIAAHFYNHLISCGPPMHAWGFYKVRRGDVPMLTSSVTAADRYSQLQALTFLEVILYEDNDCCNYFRNAFAERVPLIALDVWKLWATHLRESSPLGPPNGFIDGTFLPAPIARDKQVVLALIQQEWIIPDSDVVAAFDDDRDINLVVAAGYLLGRYERRLPSNRLLHDAEFVLEALHLADGHCDRSDLLEIVEHVRHHRAIELILVSKNAVRLSEVSEELRADREIVLTAAKSSWAFDGAAETLKCDRGFCLEAVKVNGANLKWAPVEFRGDREIVLAAVQKTGWALQYAAKPLRGDCGVVLAAVKNDASALRHASAGLRNDRQVMLQAVKSRRFTLQYASAELRSDRQLVLEAVKLDGSAFHFASVQQNDRQFVLEAVKISCHALQYASAELKNDRQVVLEAVKSSRYALEYASAELKNDRQVVLEALKSGGDALEYASEALRADGTIVLATIEQNPRVFKYASAALRGDRKFVFSCLKVLRSREDWDDWFPVFWEGVPDKVRRDQDFALQMIAKGFLALSYVPRDLSNYRQLVLCAVQNDASELFYAPLTLRRDHDFILCVVRQNGNALRWVDPALQADKNLVLAAVWQTPSALRYASQKLRNDPDIQAAARGKRTRPSS